MRYRTTEITDSEIYILVWGTHTETHTYTLCARMVLLSISAVCLYMCVVLSSLTLLASIFVMFILISRMRDTMAGSREGDKESRAGQEPVRPLCLATQL